MQQQALRDSLLKWHVDGELKFDLRDNLVNLDKLPAARRGEIPILAQRMMDAQAWGGIRSAHEHGGRYVVGRDDPEVDVLEVLSHAGIVQKLAEHAHDSEYAFTEYGLRSVRASNVLRGPSYCFHHRPLSAEFTLHDLSIYELMDMAFANGWQCRVLMVGERSKDVGVQPYVLGQAKVWYFRASKTSVSRPYLVSLLSADQTYPPIKHFLPDKSYEHVLVHKEFPIEDKKQGKRKPDKTRAGALADLEIGAIEDKKDKLPKKRPRPRRGKGGKKAKTAHAIKDTDKDARGGTGTVAALQDIVEEEQGSSASSSSSSSSSPYIFLCITIDYYNI